MIKTNWIFHSNKQQIYADGFENIPEKNGNSLQIKVQYCNWIELKHGDKRRNCLVRSISSFVAMFSKSCLLQRHQKASAIKEEFPKTTDFSFSYNHFSYVSKLYFQYLLDVALISSDVCLCRHHLINIIY